ncbi:MAG: 30S ribosomal protein S15 [Deltaproteobacteria bacterium]|nr:30S ribosomal protein S15 [Deltaproteobacteria bacterium]
MALTIDQKQDIVRKFAINPKDNGSSRVQVALITSRVNDLQAHFQKNPKDNHSRRGLLKLVGRRKRLLEYIRREDVQEYRKLIEELGLRK